MAFDALDKALLIIRLLRPLVAKVQRQDPDLARQIRRAGNGIVLNGFEAGGRIGKDSSALYRSAHGSAREVTGALLTAVAWGYLTEAECADAQRALDDERAMLWRLAGR